jgi:hypothetical protein
MRRVRTGRPGGVRRSALALVRARQEWRGRESCFTSRQVRFVHARFVQAGMARRVESSRSAVRQFRFV